MLGIPILDVALGMIFLYLMLSLVCSSVVEFFAGLRKKRAAFLTEGIIELLDDPGISQAAEALRPLVPTAQGFYDHPLIRSLYRTAPSPGGGGKEDHEQRTDAVSLGNRMTKPSYIPARTFALTLLDMVAHPVLPPGGVTPAAGTEAVPAKDGAAPVTQPPAAGQMPGVGTKVEKAVDAATRQMQELTAAVDALPDESSIKRILQVLIADARGDAEKLQANVEIWYNHAMDRVSGWYKRWSQVFIFCLSLVVSVAANADTISIGRELSTNGALRQAVAAQAEAYAKKPDAGRTAQDSSLEAIRTTVGQLNGLGISLGWTDADWKTATPGQRALKVLGLLLTAFAVSLGAPFWFDMLNKVITIRTAGKSPEDKPKSPEGGPKRQAEAPPE
jgi:hypothetical protein